MDESGLTREQLEFFAVNGYVVLENVADAEAFAAARDTAWEGMLGGVTRDPETWGRPVCDCRGEQGMAERFGLVKLRKHIRSSSALQAVSVLNPRLLAVGRQLLGSSALSPELFRGVYPIFPTPESADNPVSAHLDVTPTPFKLTYSVYLADIPPGGGALSVWPGSHRLLHGATATNACNLSDFETREFCAAYAHLNQQTPRVLPGKAGTTVVMHYRLLHAASINRIPGHVRWALYFNQASSDVTFATGKPSDNVWEGWEGIDRVDADWVRRTREPTTLASLTPVEPARHDIAWVGAWNAFAGQMARAQERFRRADAATERNSAWPAGALTPLPSRKQEPSRVPRAPRVGGLSALRRLLARPGY
jgi:ectoine hydroxylase-related dioxygenase (phytanoyl-CoA dioxygenase family)